MIKVVTICAAVLVLGFSFSCRAAPGNEIAGYWVMPDGSALIEIYLVSEGIEARIAAIREHQYTAADDKQMVRGNPRLDIHNPDPDLRQRPLPGMVIASNLRHENGRWRGGRIYDPDSGKSYRCELELDAGGFLRVRGYLGISLLGRTMYWQRAEDFRQRITAMLAALPESSPGLIPPQRVQQQAIQ